MQKKSNLKKLKHFLIFFNKNRALLSASDYRTSSQKLIFSCPIPKPPNATPIPCHTTSTFSTQFHAFLHWNHAAPIQWPVKMLSSVCVQQWNGRFGARHFFFLSIKIYFMLKFEKSTKFFNLFKIQQCDLLCKYQIQLSLCLRPICNNDQSHGVKIVGCYHSLVQIQKN